MKRSSVWILRISAVWSIWVWAVLVRNMLIDHNHALSFRVVHIVLAAISFAFAIATLVIAQQGARRIKSDQAS
jgi:hypothetical protein